MSESALERELHRRRQERMRSSCKGAPRPTRPRGGGGAGRQADGVERWERRVHERCPERTFRTVEVERLGYADPAHRSLRPLDASLNLPGGAPLAEGAPRWRPRRGGRSMKRYLSSPAIPGRRCPSVRRSSPRFARQRTSTRSTRPAVRRRASRCPRSRWWCSPSTAREWCCIARICARRRARRPSAAGSKENSSPGSIASSRGKTGKTSHSKRIATVPAVYTVAPFVRSAEDFLLGDGRPRSAGSAPRLVRKPRRRGTARPRDAPPVSPASRGRA